MAEFLYLYRGGQRGTTAEESEQIMQKWMNWMKELTASGNLKDPGQPLEAEGKVVRGQARHRDRRSLRRSEGPGRRLHARRSREPGTRRGACAADVPILDVDGIVEVRPIMKMDMCERCNPSDHLFRHEAGRMVAALTRLFGLHNLDVGRRRRARRLLPRFRSLEDSRVPENPSAWLMKTAKNRALDVLAARANRAHLRTGSRPSASNRVDRCERRRRSLRVDRSSRRPAAHDVLVLPSAACPKRRR